MRISGSHGFGGSWGTPFRMTGSNAGGGITGVRDQLRIAAGSLADAFRGFSTEKENRSTTVLYRSGATARLSGLAARLHTVAGSNSTLQTTEKVNTATSTVRASSTALGLDVTSSEASSVLASSAALGLDVSSAETASSVTSTAEMNTGETTSYGSSSLSFTGSGQASTSTGTLTGTFTGVGTAANATSLVVKITKTANLNWLLATNVKFEVRDQNNTLLFSYDGNLKSDDDVYLGADIGLTISFSGGQLTNTHTDSTAVTHTPITVNGDAAFNASASLRPQFDGAAQVTAGSFTVNGTAITVNANDTINQVISRINTSAAGVTAALSGDKITLTTTSNSEDPIVLANDTSGFLSATKLSAATSTLGNVRDDQQVFSKTSQFDDVESGSFTINGVAISVDKDADSLSSVINRINSSGSGVTASYDSATDKLRLVSSTDSEDLIVVGGDTTGFLTATSLTTGNTVRGSVRDDQQVFSKTSQFAGVTDGSFTINGATISIAADEDSLETVIAKVNAVAAGVTASYNSSTERLVLTPNTVGATFAIENDTSGFFAAAHVAEGAAGTHVNADAAFNGSGMNSALFDSGLTVQAGSFTVNGVTIAVAATDTVNTVLDKITASSAGVTASFDDDTQLITLTSKTESEDAITVGNDTSGFLAAVKLNGMAESTTGALTVLPFDSSLDRISEYSGVGQGTVVVNGHAIAVDPETTSVRDLVSAVDDLEEVGARLDEDTGTIKIWSERSGDAVSVSDSAGVLASLGIATGTVEGSKKVSETKSETVTVSNANDVADRVSIAADKLNEALSQLKMFRGSGKVRSNLEESVRRAIDAFNEAGAKGLSLESDSDELSVAVDVEEVASALDNGFDGATAAIDELLEQFEEETSAIAGPEGGQDPVASSLALSFARKPSVPATRPNGAAALEKSLRDFLNRESERIDYFA